MNIPYFFSIPVSPIPDILESTPGKIIYNCPTSPTVSKLHPPL